jgi:hypothetical protein
MKALFILVATDDFIKRVVKSATWIKEAYPLASSAAKSKESSMALMASLNETAPLLYDYESSFLASLIKPTWSDTVLRIFSV